MEGVRKDTEPALLSYILSLLGTLLLVPDNPEYGVLMIAKGVLNVVAEYTWYFPAVPIDFLPSMQGS